MFHSYNLSDDLHGFNQIIDTQQTINVIQIPEILQNNEQKYANQIYVFTKQSAI